MGASALRPIDRRVGRDGARRTGRRRHLHLGRGAPDAVRLRRLGSPRVSRSGDRHRARPRRGGPGAAGSHGGAPARRPRCSSPSTPTRLASATRTRPAPASCSTGSATPRPRVPAHGDRRPRRIRSRGCTGRDHDPATGRDRRPGDRRGDDRCVRGSLGLRGGSTGVPRVEDLRPDALARRPRGGRGDRSAVRVRRERARGRSAPSVSVRRGGDAASPGRSCPRRSRCSGAEASPT